MARIKNGILGGFSGRIGPVEGYIRKGVACIRSKKRKANGPVTKGQAANRSRMSVVNAFIDTMTEFVRMGFTPSTKDKNFTANNAAKGYQMDHALEGEFPDLKINYAAVQLSQGKLQMPLEPQVNVDQEGLLFSWQVDPHASYQNRRAQAMVLVYCPELHESCYSLTGARRTSCEELLLLPVELKGMELHAYLAFVSDDRNQVSNTTYLGNIIF